MPQIIVRPSTNADVAPCQAIYAHHVATGTGTFEIEAPSLQDMFARRADVLAKNLPYLVLEVDGVVLGFAYCNWFKPRPAYRFSAEDSIYLHPDAAGSGKGKLLLLELCASAERAGLRKLIAVIGDSANEGSIGVHRSMGFTDVGVIRNCGWKFGAWRDIVMMEKTLGLAANAPPN